MNPTTEQVRALYESYPYPPLEQALGFPVLAALDYVRCVLWPRRPSLQGIRVLDAGCGTGHVAVEIAQRYPEVEVVGLDLSAPALDVARRRAERAGVRGNLSFHQGALEDLSSLAIAAQPFDYIVSSGVLHHLSDPSAGTRALAAHLSPTGAIGLMVYAPHGRHGVYVLQELLRRMAGDRPLSEQVVIARQVLSTLPENHPFRAKEFADQDWQGDAGLVDLLLHVQDRSFTVPELRGLLGSADLKVARFFLPYLYRPESYFSAGKTTETTNHSSDEDPAAIAELLAGTMRMHVALACHNTFQPQAVSAGTVGAFAGRPLRSPLLRWEERRALKQSRGKGQGHILSITVSERTYTGSARDLSLEGEPALLLERSDGTRTSEEIFADPTLHAALVGHSEEDKRKRFNALLSFMLQQDFLYLMG